MGASAPKLQCCGFKGRHAGRKPPVLADASRTPILDGAERAQAPEEPGWGQQGAVARILGEEAVKRRVAELEQLAFSRLHPEGRSVENPQDDTGEDAFFLDVLQRLECSDEFESNSAGGVRDDSDAESVADDGASPAASHDEGFRRVSVGLGADEEEPVADWELLAAWNSLRRRELPKPGLSARIVRAFARLYSASPSLVELPAPPSGGRLVIVGDLHGHFSDLFHILDSFGEPCSGPGGTQYLFNGDFVDRGSWGPEVLLTVLCLKLLNPNAVHVNRGNHEDIKQNQTPENGFQDVHCVRAFLGQADAMYRLFELAFAQMPLCHVLGGEIAVLHGGLPLDSGVTLEEIRSISRQRPIPSHRYTVNGYRPGQKVRARRDLQAVGGTVPRGSPGQLLRRHRRSDRAEARFRCAPKELEAAVAIKGSPDLEEDVDIVFDSEEDRLEQRSDRLFVALMWSDPVCRGTGGRVGPNVRRGAGSFFDERVAEAFLRENELRCLVRSHEKQEEGSAVKQRFADGSLMTVTVFSASNYPCGAGEPGGNRAGVLVAQAVEAEQGGSIALTSTFTWQEPYLETPHWTRSRRRSSLRRLARRVGEAWGRPSARTQALQQLWRLIFCARPALLSYFNHADREAQGTASLSEWVGAMRACIIPDEDFPWERLARHLVHVDPRGRCHYGAFLRRFQNAISSRLEARFSGVAMAQLLEGLGGGSGLEKEWAFVDRDGNGRVSYNELRLLFHRHAGAHAGHGLDLDADDDRAFAVLASMDRDLSGWVDREEFLLAAASAGRDDAAATREEAEPLVRCWAALHGVLRALALSRCQVEAIFHAMDTEKDGVLCRKEFQEGLQRLLRGSPLLGSSADWEPLLWHLVDEDGSGTITPEELAAALRVADVVAGRPRPPPEAEAEDGSAASSPAAAAAPAAESGS